MMRNLMLALGLVFLAVGSAHADTITGTASYGCEADISVSIACGHGHSRRTRMTTWKMVEDGEDNEQTPTVGKVEDGETWSCRIDEEEMFDLETTNQTDARVEAEKIALEDQEEEKL
jgi:ribosomal protein L37E